MSRLVPFICLALATSLSACSATLHPKWTTEVDYRVDEDVRREVKQPRIKAAYVQDRDRIVAEIEHEVQCQQWTLTHVDKSDVTQVRYAAWSTWMEPTTLLVSTLAGLALGWSAGNNPDSAFHPTVQEDSEWEPTTKGLVFGGLGGFAAGTLLPAVVSTPIRQVQSYRGNRKVYTDTEEDLVTSDGCRVETAVNETVSMTIRMHDGTEATVRGKTGRDGKVIWSLGQITKLRGGSSLIRDIKITSSSAEKHEVSLSTEQRYGLTQLLQDGEL